MRVFLFFICIQFMNAQGFQLEEIESFPFQTKSFVGVDKFGFTYSIDRNTFYKIKGNEKYEYREIQLGNIASVDLNNPLRIVLFFRESNSVVMLDNRLNELKRIKFDQLRDSKNVEFASLANDQSLWLFNIDSQELEIYDFNRDKVLIQSLPITKEVIQMKSNFNFCYVLFEDELRIYNAYGSMVFSKETNLNDFVIYKNSFLGWGNDSIVYSKNREHWQEEKKSVDFNGKQLYLTDQNFYIYDGKKITINKITSK